MTILKTFMTSIQLRAIIILKYEYHVAVDPEKIFLYDVVLEVETEENLCFGENDHCAGPFFERECEWLFNPLYLLR